MLLSFWGHAFCGILLGVLIFADQNWIRGFANILFFFTLLFYIASFHYELTFVSLIHADTIYYLKEIRHLLPSIRSNLPAGIIIAEILGGCMLMFAGKIIIEKKTENRIYSRKTAIFCCSFFIISFLFPLFQHSSSMFKSESALHRAAKNPILWLARTYFAKENRKKETDFSPEQIAFFQKELGHLFPFGGIYGKFPLWSDIRRIPDKKTDKKSVILLILESVGTKEMYSVKDGKPLMPNLRKIAEENLFFKNSYAGGTKSNQVLPAVFSGIPPQTYQNILWKEPLPNLDMLPSLLSEKGYETAYFHGSDLSFEQQRNFLKMAGFRYIFDYNAALEKTVSGWGYDDRTMFSLLKEWIGKQNSPYMAALFTLSTHDPFVLPQDWKPEFVSRPFSLNEDGSWFKAISLKDRYAYYQESLFFLDTELGKFYEWFCKKEKPEGTLLVIMSDHVTYLHNESSAADKEHMRFFTPLIFAGLPDDLLQQYRRYADRRVSHFDIPATLAAYIGLPPLPEDQGLNLFMPEDFWPKDRLIYSVGGHQLEKIYMWTNHVQAELDRINNQFEVVNSEVPEHFVPAAGADLKKLISERLVPFYNILIPLNRYLLENNAYTPSENMINNQRISPLPKVKKPIFASHRGNISGMREKSKQNKAEAIEEAIREGFAWIKIDALLTKDGIPVLLHDNEVEFGNGEKTVIENIRYEDLKKIPFYSDILPLNETIDRYIEKIGMLIEIKALQNIDKMIVFNRKVADIIQKHPLKHKIIIDSFSRMSAAFINNRCECSAGLDTPYQKKLSDGQLKHIRLSGFEWIYVHHSVVDTELIRKAHAQGIKVMVYTVNDMAMLSAWMEQLPDGIITDYRRLEKEFLAAAKDRGQEAD
jgi:glycerophosphoryl diester phosphodiesterase